MKWIAAKPAIPTPIICKICDRGELRHRTLYRMDPVVVFIGYVLLIPSIIGKHHMNPSGQSAERGS